MRIAGADRWTPLRLISGMTLVASGLMLVGAPLVTPVEAATRAKASIQISPAHAIMGERVTIVGKVASRVVRGVVLQRRSGGVGSRLLRPIHPTTELTHFNWKPNRQPRLTESLRRL